MGWVEYSRSLGIGHNTNPQPFADDPLVKFFFDEKDEYICYIIKGYSKSEMRIPKGIYKFITMDYNPVIVKSGNSPKFTIVNFESNQELFSLVIKNKACNKEYKRYFTINNILQ
jgi:hypothetical protein